MATTLNRRRHTTGSIVKEKSEHELESSSTATLSSSVTGPVQVLSTLGQLCLVWIVLCGPIGPQLLEDPIGRLRVATLLLGLLRVVQSVQASKSTNNDNSDGIRRSAKERLIGRVHLAINQHEQDPWWQAGILTLGVTLVGATVLHVVAVLFGAHIVNQFSQTWYGALFISLMAIAPAVTYLGYQWLDWLRVFGEHKPENTVERNVYYPLIMAVIGAWMGGLVLPLDWDRPWQVWPIPSVFGATVGYTTGVLTSLILMTCHA